MEKKNICIYITHINLHEIPKKHIVSFKFLLDSSSDDKKLLLTNFSD